MRKDGYDVLDDVAVRLGSGEQVLARTYIGSELNHDLRPYDWYRAYVIAGAMQHGLATSWIASLEATAYMRDPNLRRRQAALDTLRAVGYAELLEALPV